MMRNLTGLPMYLERPGQLYDEKSDLRSAVMRLITPGNGEVTG